MSSPVSAQARHRLPPDDVLRMRVKVEIRKRLRGLRKTTPLAACAERSTQIVEHLDAHPGFRAAKTVALFWPIEERHEVDLRPLDARLRARGVKVAYPSVLSSGEMIFTLVDDVDSMRPHPLGFQEPATGELETAEGPLAVRLELDVIVVPAIALDPTGQRIGYGAGHYDRALLSHGRAMTFGVAYDFQLIPEVPATEGDVPVQWIVTDRRVLEASRDAALHPEGEAMLGDDAEKNR
jgi:5-formyltetrahydrofolate cyclo-ligase